MQDDAGLSYLFAAYSVIWVVLLGYVARLRQRQQELWKAVARLEGRDEPGDHGRIGRTDRIGHGLIVDTVATPLKYSSTQALFGSPGQRTTAMSMIVAPAARAGRPP